MINVDIKSNGGTDVSSRLKVQDKEFHCNVKRINPNVMPKQVSYLDILQKYNVDILLKCGYHMLQMVIQFVL